MDMGKETTNKPEWRLNVPNDKQEESSQQQGKIRKLWSRLKMSLLKIFVLNVRDFLVKAWKIAIAEPKKVIHGVKVGLALSIVSVVYYMRPLYAGLGGNAMWAVMTVVVVLEYTVGATLCKSINRVVGTFVAGSLGLGVHWVAHQSSKDFEPVVVGFSVFVFASAATFSRFVPSVKTKFDYGAMIFILTFSLVTISGYRVDKLVDMARHRLSTIAIGTGLCICISILCCPIWAGEELHTLIYRNMEKLADSLDGCAAGHFARNEEQGLVKKSDAYRCIMDSKATEDQMANLAKWELAHRRFGFLHPWKQYLIIGTSMRSCACCLEILDGFVATEIQVGRTSAVYFLLSSSGSQLTADSTLKQAPESLMKHLRGVSLNFSSYASNVMKDLAVSVKTMKRSSNVNLSLEKMRAAAEELRNTLKSLPNEQLVLNQETSAVSTEITAGANPLPIMVMLAIVTVASLLIEIAAKIEVIVGAVDELAKKARFKLLEEERMAVDQHCNESYNEELKTMSTTEKA